MMYTGYFFLLASLLLVTRLSTGLPVNIETQSEDIYTQLSEPSIQSQAYNSFLMGLMCQQNLESTSCQQRTICLSTGDVYKSTCDYHNAKCKGLVPSTAIMVKCRKEFQLVDCKPYEKQKCSGELDPVCGHESDRYFINKCQACKHSDRDRLGDYVKISEDRRCIMNQTNDSKLQNWASRMGSRLASFG